MRIAGFTSPQSASSYHRTIYPLTELGRRGHGALIVPLDGRADARVLECDVAYFQRYQGREAERTMRRLRERGLAVVWDHDDNLIAAPQLEKRALSWQNDLAETRSMLRLADVVTTTNARLADVYRELGAGCVHVVENHLPPCFDDVHPRPHAGVVVGWIAWADHQEDWNRLGLRETFTRLLAAHPELRVESVGPIDLGLPADRYRHIAPVPFERLPELISGFDVGIAPLLDSPFNQTRSNVKVKEYAGAGVPWLASRVGPYEELGEAQGGRLVADGDWHDELERLVTRPRARRKLAKRAARWASGQTVAANAGAWEAAFEEALERRRRVPGTGDARPAQG